MAKRLSNIALLLAEDRLRADLQKAEEEIELQAQLLKDAEVLYQEELAANEAAEARIEAALAKSVRLACRTCGFPNEETRADVREIRKALKGE